MHQHFRPDTSTDRPCWHCTYFDRVEPAGCGLCNRPNASRRVAMPARGCVFWQREPGTDDEPDRLPEHVAVAVQGAQVWRAADPPPVRQPVRWAP